jgi:hypothetical protein
MAWPNPNSRFQRDGGRAGYIRFAEGEKHGLLEWEMLVGDRHMVIYGRRSRWVAPESQAISRADLRALVQEFATDSGTRVVLEYAPGDDEDIDPGAV